MTQPPSRALALAEAWIAVLLAPAAWVTALGVMFSLTNETCAGGTRAPLLAVAGACTLLTLAPAPLAWFWRRRLDGASAASERARFMMALSIGASALFTLVMLVSTVPIFLLGACRT